MTNGTEKFDQILNLTFRLKIFDFKKFASIWTGLEASVVLVLEQIPGENFSVERF